MFSGVMVNAWAVGTVIAVVAGVVGYFVVLRGSSFVAHAIPNAAFAGAAGASLVGVSTLLGLGVFAFAGAAGIAWLGRRGRHDVATALAIVVMLGLGALFLSWGTEYEPEISALLFGNILGVSNGQLVATAVLGAIAVLTTAAVFRPLLLSSVLPEVGEARGVRASRIEVVFLMVVALATAMAVPVVGTLLMFSLMVAPPAAAGCWARRPGSAVALSMALALATVWASVALSYRTNWPVGFFVGTIGAAWYLAGRVWQATSWRWGSRGARGPASGRVGATVGFRT